MRTGQETDIGAPPLKPRRWGLLLDAAEEMALAPRPKILADGAADGTERPAMPTSEIGRGVTFTPYGCQGLTRSAVDFCEEEDLDAAVSGGDLPVFEAFDIYATEECSTLDVDIAWLNERLSTRWRAFISAAVMAEMTSGGHVGADTPTLVNSAVAFADSLGTLAPGEALAAIESWLEGKLSGAQGAIYMSASVLTFLGEYLELVDGQWYTRTGHIVISDAGFGGPAPSGQSSGPGDSWIYGSGLPAVKVGPPRELDQTAVQYLDRTRNIATGRIMGSAVFAFEPCSVGAVRTDPLGLGS